MASDVMLLEDDEAYTEAVRAHFEQSHYALNLHHATNIGGALAVCHEYDIRVAIIDLALENGAAGTEAITAISGFDKKIIFVIHSVSPPEAIADWSTRIGVPYTSQFFLQKTGSMTVDAARLHEMTAKALRSYVPHLPPPLTSVGDVVETVSRYVERHPSLRPSAVVSNIHYAQDVMNAMSQWAADRLARTGYDSTRVAVLMTGSFARLEASAASDADYFLVFDDTALGPERLEELTQLAYAMFLEVARWFERNSVPVHDAGAEAKQPANIEWHSTTLPTWFPLSSLLKVPLGRTTQLELTKQWFLLESRPLFNLALAESIRHKVANSFAVSTQKTVRDAVVHSQLPESLRLLIEEFDYAYRNRGRDSLRTVKHYFMRMVNLYSIKLWLLRCFLDPQIFNEPAERLLAELSPLPAARLMEFATFLQRVPVLDPEPLKQCLSKLDAILNSYAEAAHALAVGPLRQERDAAASTTFINDLEDSAKACGNNLEAIMTLLRDSSYVSGHAEVLARKIV